MASEQDTIVAIATPPGRGGVGVVRISGQQTSYIAKRLLGDIPAPRHATLRNFKAADGAIIDTGIAIHFPAPASFTGEDVLELQGHGGPMVLDLLIKRILQLNARLAEPGEFSRRAFLNEKIDLVQAEAIADLIGAESEQAARAAIRSMQGEFSTRLHELTEALITTRMHVEAAIDFPDEELDLIQDQALLQRLNHAVMLSAQIQEQAHAGSALREGLTVVIAGKPNAGKSSILNRLAGYEAAIVTEVPGTTRDVLREKILIDGMPLHILDTAGLRDTQDRVEAEGIKRAYTEISKADHILYVVDATHYDQQELDIALKMMPPNVGLTVLLNKCDLVDQPCPMPLCGVNLKTPLLAVSALSSAGMDTLRDHLKRVAGLTNAEGGVFLARRRHLDALERADSHIQKAQQNLLSKQAGELCAEELRLAQNDLAQITGEFTSDDLLGRIFSSFCIGK